MIFVDADPVKVAMRICGCTKGKEKFRKISRRLRFTEAETECLIHFVEL